MGSFISRQPNGLLCRFSSVVDTVTHYNMTEQDYIDYCVEKAVEEAKDVLANYVRPFDLVKKRFLPYNISIEEFEKMLLEMGDKEGLGEERINELKRLEDDWLCKSNGIIAKASTETNQ